MKLDIVTTADGSTTLYRPDLDEHYHSIHGAIQEAVHVYINAGYNFLNDNQNRILEIGFGTGLNALLTCEASTKDKKSIIYHSIDNNFLNEELLSSLDFGTHRKALLQKLHKAPLDTLVDITPFFKLKKTEANLLDYTFSEMYDLIYFDAFAPDKQPEMWSEKILSKISSCLSSKGILTTYSTKGLVKQRFRKSKLEVKRLPGPPGKRDMLRCIKL